MTRAPDRHLRGGGEFTADHARPDDLVMAVLRSPVAHGRILGVDLGGAAGLTGADLDRAGLGPIAPRALPLGEDGQPMIAPPRPVLATDRVVHVGQPVAAVWAETAAAALDALEAIALEIEPLPAALAPGEGPQIWPEAPGNRALAWSNGNAAETERLIATAAHVVEAEIAHPRIAINPMEPRACIAAFEDGRYTLIAPSQGVVAIRHALAGCLGVPTDRLRVLTPDVGGSFAARIWPYPEYALALAAARLTGRRVRWTCERTEGMTADIPGRGRIDRAELALDAEGRFLAFRVRARADLGAFVGTAAPGVVTSGAVRPFAQLYAIPGQHYRVEASFTNLTPTDAYRGAGKPETTATLERLIDLAAARTGLDRLEIRRRNLIAPADLPLTTPMGEVMDAGDFPGLARRIAPLWAGLEDRRAEAAARGRLLGAGLSFHCHATGGSVAERAQVRALRDGTVEVVTGSQDTGQGHARALARVAAAALDLGPDRIRVVQGDSDRLTDGGGSGGSNLLPVSGPTVTRAALAMLDAARTAAAHLLEAAEADLAYAAGSFRIAGTDRTIGLDAIAAALDETAGTPGGCAAERGFEGTHTTWPNGVYLAEVELDPDTGATRLVRFTGISDIGRIVDEPGALGQIQGGIAQSVGEALMEAMVHDADGQPLTGSLMDYALPRAADTCGYDLGWAPTDSPNTPLGAKGVGELPSIGAPAALAGAVLDALAPLGVTHLDKPLTPMRIWQAIREARA